MTTPDVAKFLCSMGKHLFRKGLRTANYQHYKCVDCGAKKVVKR